MKDRNLYLRIYALRHLHIAVYALYLIAILQHCSITSLLQWHFIMAQLFNGRLMSGPTHAPP